MVNKAKSPFGGRLNMFVYAPKFARKLPYYDTFPLVLPLRVILRWFSGYQSTLPTNINIRLLDRLNDFSNNTKFDESTL